jgi:hypothetical protein
VSGKRRCHILRLWKESRGPELLLLEMLAKAAYGMARPRNAGNDLPIRGQAENTLFPSGVACKDYVEAKVRWIHGSEAGHTSSESREIVARNFPERQPTADALLAPALVCCRYADDHCNSSVEQTRWMRSS